MSSQHLPSDRWLGIELPAEPKAYCARVYKYSADAIVDCKPSSVHVQCNKHALAFFSCLSSRKSDVYV